MEALLAEAEISFSKRKKSQRQIEVSEVKMMFNSLKEVDSGYRILHGEKGKRYYVLSAKLLEKRYPVEESKYQPFMPKWAESLCSKEEAWDFFIKKENLVFKKGKNKLINTDFSEGIPIDLRF